MSKEQLRHPLHDNFVAFYDNRAPDYDHEPSKWHHHLARDLVQWAVPILPESLKNPAKVLDLCCGTGLVSFAELDILGKDTVLHGVDISKASLEIARQKAIKANATHTQFFQNSVVDLESLDLEKGSYSLITCCSALVLLPDSLPSILRKWGEYLRPGGVLIFDVPTAVQRVPGMLYSTVASFGLPVVDQGWIKSEESVKTLIQDAGLKVHDVFKTGSYETVITKVEDAEQRFQKSTQGRIFNLQRLTEEQLEEARKLFIQKMKDAGDENGIISEELKFYIGIATR